MGGLISKNDNEYTNDSFIQKVKNHYTLIGEPIYQDVYDLKLRCGEKRELYSNFSGKQMIVEMIPARKDFQFILPVNYQSFIKNKFGGYCSVKIIPSGTIVDINEINEYKLESYAYKLDMCNIGGIHLTGDGENRAFIQDKYSTNTDVIVTKYTGTSFMSSGKIKVQYIEIKKDKAKIIYNEWHNFDGPINSN
jgi:hypothetical protein